MNRSNAGRRRQERRTRRYVPTGDTIVSRLYNDRGERVRVSARRALRALRDMFKPEVSESGTIIASSSGSSTSVQSDNVLSQTSSQSLNVQSDTTLASTSLGSSGSSASVICLGAIPNPVVDLTNSFNSIMEDHGIPAFETTMAADAAAETMAQNRPSRTRSRTRIRTNSGTATPPLQMLVFTTQTTTPLFNMPNLTASERGSEEGMSEEDSPLEEGEIPEGEYVPSTESEIIEVSRVFGDEDYTGDGTHGMQVGPDGIAQQESYIQCLQDLQSVINRELDEL